MKTRKVSRSRRVKKTSRRKKYSRRTTKKVSRSRRRCPRGQILRKAYTRRSPTGKRIRVKGACIKDRGKPGKGRKLLPKLKKGKLTSHGYSSSDTIEKRHTALRKAIRAQGANTVIRQLNAVYVLNKNTNPKLAAKFKKDQRWVSANY